MWMLNKRAEIASSPLWCAQQRCSLTCQASRHTNMGKVACGDLAGGLLSPGQRTMGIV